MAQANSGQHISAERRAQLHGGAPSHNLAEILCVDFARLLQQCLPQADAALLDGMQQVRAQGVVKRMQRAGELLAARLGQDGLAVLAAQQSDTLRGFACYALAALPQMDLPQRLQRMQALADDAHFGVREWAWLALRPLLLAELPRAIRLLEAWTLEASANLRRFASESLRPRGVWCSHSKALQETPALALPLLEPLKADSAVYVQDSVSNWLNDASKSQPDWVRELCQRWQQQSRAAATQRICKRALRSLQA